MADLPSIIARVRSELGDTAEQTQSSFVGDGNTTVYPFPVGSLSSIVLQLIPATGGAPATLASSAYTFNTDVDTITLATALPANAVLLATGTSYAIFSDAELTILVNDALGQHTHGSTTVTRYLDQYGFVQYYRAPMTLADLPPVEEYLVALLATIQALWTLATDASTDIDISSAEGTSLNRSQRFGQVRSQIEALQGRYRELCAQLNVGLYRIEVTNLRRVSRTTNRLVPLFAEREYDEHALPTRLLPPVDSPNQDESGVPSPAYYGNAF